MFKRVLLFMAMNIAVIILITAIFAVLERYFGITLDLYGQNYVSIGIYSAIIGFSGAFISLAISRWMAKKAYGIVPITNEESFELTGKERLVWDTVGDLSQRNGIEMPEVGIYDSEEPNAFATGMSKNSSLVAVSSGLLANMDNGAIEGVVAHEMAHILNGDMVTMTLLQGVLNTFVVFFARVVSNLIANRLGDGFSWISYFLVNITLQIIFGLFASIIAMAFSRHREFRADAGSAQYVGKEKMIAGLQALKKTQNMVSGEDSKMATMQISTKGRGGIMKLFSSHPDLDDRIKALEEMKI